MFVRSLFLFTFSLFSFSIPRYCEEHFYALFGEQCHGCSLVIHGDVLNTLGESWHPACFKCTTCGEQFGDDRFFQRDGLPYVHCGWVLADVLDGQMYQNGCENEAAEQNHVPHLC